MWEKLLQTDNNEFKSWILPKPLGEVNFNTSELNLILQKVLLRRGLDINRELNEYITPSELPNPELHFGELSKATKRIIDACKNNEKIAICGDYDADGITSTVLLVELLSILGARVEAFIPSRKDEGYGLNTNIVNEINNKKTKLIITVDNGISAFDAINKTIDYGIDLIITDHHKIPDVRLNIFSLIHPENTPLYSPYKYLAGVGIAYLLAHNICSKLDFDINQTSSNVLFCIGTIADMAPLKGANRKWLKDFLPKFNTTNNLGIKSIINKLSLENLEITSEHIGYKIAPLINAVGRIAEPNLIIDLFTNKSQESVESLTKECLNINYKRKRITLLIEDEAMKMALSEYKHGNKFLVLTKREWHPGIIGIVAARIVEKFNLPTALLALANDGTFRGSIRSNNKLKVNQALQECNDLLLSHGGHSAAAGFSILEENIIKLKKRLNNIALREFKNINLTKSIKPEACISLNEINEEFYRQIRLIGPFGIMNPAPIFWTRKCQIKDIYKLKGGHLKITIDDGTSSIVGIKWNGNIQLYKNDFIDIAFYIEENNWKKTKKLQLNIIDIKKHTSVVDLQIHNNLYKCQLINNNVFITNARGQHLSSDLMTSSDVLNTEQRKYADKIISFAEIALGMAA